MTFVSITQETRPSLTQPTSHCSNSTNLSRPSELSNRRPDPGRDRAAEPDSERGRVDTSGREVARVFHAQEKQAMKWTTLIGSLVISIALSSSSQGAGLLDRILHSKNCGCETKPVQKSKPEPKCGAEKTKTKHKPKCGTPKQKHTAKTKSKSKGGNLLQDLANHLNLNGHLSLGHRSKSKSTPKTKATSPKQKHVAKPKPKCGASKQKHVVKPKCGVAKHKRLAFPRLKSNGRAADAPSQPTATGARISPIPPAPIVDPSAFLHRSGHVTKASFSE